MTNFDRIAAAIDLRVRQLEASGVHGGALAEPMLGHTAELDQIYRTASDDELGQLVDRYPGFARYARLMEQVSERNEQMLAEGTHPYSDLPRLPEPLGCSPMAVMRDAAEIEREFQVAVDAKEFDQAGRLAAMRRRWAEDLEQLIAEVRASELPASSQTVLQKVLKVAAERITRLARSKRTFTGSDSSGHNTGREHDRPQRLPRQGAPAGFGPSDERTSIEHEFLDDDTRMPRAGRNRITRPLAPSTTRIA